MMERKWDMELLCLGAIVSLHCTVGEHWLSVFKNQITKYTLMQRFWLRFQLNDRIISQYYKKGSDG